MPGSHVGLGVTRDTFVWAADGDAVCNSVPHTSDGVAALVATLQSLAPSLVVVVANRGWEVPLVAQCVAGRVPTVVVDASDVDRFARGAAQPEGTDATDPRLIARFAARVQPVARPLPDAARDDVHAMLVRRRQLVEMCTTERERVHQSTSAVVREDVSAHVAWLDSRIAAADRELQRRTLDVRRRRTLLQRGPSADGAFVPRRVLFSLIAVGLLAAALSGAGVSWDGAYFLTWLLDHGTPWIAHGRYSTALVSLPAQAVVAVAGRAIDHTGMFEVVYGLCWAAVPLASLAFSLVLAGGSRELTYAVVLSQVLACLPGQFFFVSDAAATAQVGSLLILLVAVAAPSLALGGVTGALALFLAFLHPSSALVLFGAALTCLAQWIRGRQDRRWLILVVGLTGLALARLFVPLTRAEREELQWPVLVFHFRHALAGWPLVIVGATWSAAAVVLFVSRAAASERVIRAARVTLYLIASVVVVAALIWAGDVRRWAWALNYRRFVVPASLPISLAAALFWVGRIRPTVGPRQATGGPRPPGVRLPAGPLVMLAAGAAATLLLQASQWTMLRGRLTAQLRETRGLLSLRVDAPWALTTPLEHWALPYHSLLLQGRRPTALAFTDEPADFAADSLPVMPGLWLRVSNEASGWFNTAALVDALRLRQPAPEFGDGFWQPELQDGVPFRWARQRAVLRIHTARAGRIRLDLRPFTPYTKASFWIEVHVGSREVGRLEASTQRFGAAPSGSVVVDLSPGLNTLELVATSPEISFGPHDPRAVAFGLTLPAVVAAATEPSGLAR